MDKGRASSQVKNNKKAAPIKRGHASSQVKDNATAVTSDASSAVGAPKTAVISTATFTPITSTYKGALLSGSDAARSSSEDTAATPTVSSDLETYVAQVDSNITALHEEFHSFCEALDRGSDRSDRKVDAITSRLEDLLRTEASAREASRAEARSAAEARDARTITIIDELREESKANAERQAALLSAQTEVFEKLSTPTPSLDLQPLVDVLTRQATTQNMHFLTIMDAVTPVRPPPARPLDTSSVHSDDAQAQGLSDSGDAPLQVHLGERSSRSAITRMYHDDDRFGTPGDPNNNTEGGIAPAPGGGPNGESGGGSGGIAPNPGDSPYGSDAGDDADDPTFNFWEVDIRNFSAGQTIRPSWRARHPAYYGGSEIERQLAAPLPDLTINDLDVVKFIVSSYRRVKQEKSDSKRVTQFTTFFPTPSVTCPLIATLTKLIKHVHQNVS